MRRRGEQAEKAQGPARRAQEVDALCQELNRRAVAQMDRQTLLEEFEPLCIRIVDRLAVRFKLRSHVSRDDMMAQARLGLLEAAGKYDPEQGARFATFAYYRIQGAVIDGLRAGGHLKRRSRSQAALASASAQLQAHTPQEQSAWTASSQRSGLAERVAQIDATVCHHGMAWMLLHEADARQEVQAARSSPRRQLLEAEQRQHLREAIETLSEKERYCIEEHFLKEKKYQEIAAHLGCSTSWVSRAIKRSLEKLYKRITQRDYARPG
jgi:RNA polymerase sigma factor for flagellar operon FliA